MTDEEGADMSNDEALLTYDAEMYVSHRRGLAAALRSIRSSYPKGNVVTEAIDEAVKALNGEPVTVAANHVCAAVPGGYEVDLCMENGAAWVALWRTDPHGAEEVELPDSADKSLWTQLFEAIEAAVYDDMDRRK